MVFPGLRLVRHPWQAALVGLLLGQAAPVAAHQAVDPAIVAMVQPSRNKSVSLNDPALIERGRVLFNQGTFNGNGRTCASCHPPSNNFTIDVPYLQKLGSKDPLFVAEFNPQLKQLENAGLLRRFGLITENLDGFDQPGVLRSVPHTLGLKLTIAPDKGVIGTRAAFPLASATGWSGDGAPGDGSLKMFALGGVVQHFPKTLARVAGKDFRVPTEDELNAILAYELSLGPQEEMQLDPILPGVVTFRDAAVESGKALFNGAANARGGGTRGCNGCHSNAGANDKDGNNRLFSTGTEFVANAPPCLAVPGSVPGDGGYRPTPVTTLSSSTFCGSRVPSFTITYRGEGTFNTPPLVEAADTGPFFHNNTAATIEDAVAFYTTDAFNSSPNGNGRAFILSPTEIGQIGAFLRSINAVENIREAKTYLDRATGLPPEAAKSWAQLALAQTNDAIKDLTASPLKLFTSTNPVQALGAARDKISTAVAKPGSVILAAAKADLDRARSLLLQ